LEEVNDIQLEETLLGIYFDPSKPRANGKYGMNSASKRPVDTSFMKLHSLCGSSIQVDLIGNHALCHASLTANLNPKHAI